MAKKVSEFNLLLPSLALSALVFLLVIFIVNLPKKQQSSAKAVENKSDTLSSQDDPNSLQNDLILLESDDLDQEISILRSIE